MTAYYLEVRFQLTPAHEVDEFSDLLMEALLVEPNITDPDLGVNLDDALVDATMVVEAEDQAGAMSIGFAALRSACHKVGGHTPGWEAHLERALAMVRPPESAGV